MEISTTLLLGVLIVSVWGLIAVIIWLALRGRGEIQSEQIVALQVEMKALREQVGQNLGTVTQQVAVFGSVQDSEVLDRMCCEHYNAYTGLTMLCGHV